MNKADIVYQRLQNQRLSSTKLKRPVDVVHWLGAIQAQDFNAAKWAIAQRMRDATNTLIEEAYNEGKILRTHLMRPTWHFVAADDIRWLLQLTASRVNIKCRSNYRKLELDDRIFKRCNQAFTRALKGRNHLTRAALREVLNEAGVPVQDSERLAHILLRAELDGVICSGPLVGNQFTYALLDERVPERKTLNRDEALAKITRRYFTSHGPATLQDFTWWSGLTALDAKHGIALVERHLTRTLCDDKVYWSSRSGEAVQRPLRSAYLRTVGTTHGPLRSAYLLPAFDEYIVAYKDRKAIFDLSDSKLLVTPNGILGPTVIIDGKIAGSWKATKIVDGKIAGSWKATKTVDGEIAGSWNATKTVDGEIAGSRKATKDREAVSITVKPFRPLKKSEKLAITMAADRYGKFFGGQSVCKVLWCSA